MKHLMISLAIVVAASTLGCRHQQAAQPTTLPVGSFARVWSTDVDLAKGNRITELHLRDEALFVYSADRTVFVYSRTGGEMMHMENPVKPGARLRPPVVLSDYIVYPSDSTLEVFSRRGFFRRTIHLPFSIRSNAVGSGVDVYLGADNPTAGRFADVKLDNDSVPVRWELHTYGSVIAAPVLHQGVLYMGTTDGRVFAITPIRNSIWPFSAGFRLADGAGVLGDVKADDYGVYVAGTDGKLFCLDRGNGKIRWQYFATRALLSGPTVTPSTVYQPVKDVGMVAIDKINGAYSRPARWTNPSVVQILAEDNKYVYARMVNNQIAALDRATGEVRFMNSRKDLKLFVTNLKDNLIYAATAEGYVVAIRPVVKPGSVGELVWDESPILFSPVAMAN